MLKLHSILRIVLAFQILAARVPLAGQEKSIRPEANKEFESPNLDFAKWVERFEKDGREIYDKRNEIVAACALQPGMAVADVGAGTGLFTRLFAKAVGPEGRVYAVDIAKAFVENVEQSCRDAGLRNVTGILCTADDAKLPPDSVDLVFTCDTYHHFEFPFKTLASIHKALRPGGRLVVIDFKRVEGQSPDWILKHVRAGQEVVVREIESCGFQFLCERLLLSQNYLLEFRRVDK